MTDRVRVLYVTDDASTGKRLESHFEDDRPAVTLSFVTSVEQALAVLETDPIDHVVLDSLVSDWDDNGGDRASLARASARASAGTHVHFELASEPEHASTSKSNSELGRASPESNPRSSESNPRPASDARSERMGRSETEQIEALAERIETTVGDESAAEADEETATTSNERIEATAQNDDEGITSDGGIQEQYFRVLAETHSDAILVIDADSKIRFANPAVEDVFGYRPEKLVGESLTELMPPDLAERHREGIRRYLREGEQHLDWSGIELVGRHRDGREVPLEVSFSEFTTDGETWFTGIVRDVSDRKRREAELRDRIEQRDALATFSRHALEDRPLDELMDEAAEIVADALDHEYAGVLEFRPDEDDFVVRAVSGWPAELVDSETLGTALDSQAGYTLLTSEPVVAEQLENEDRFSRDELLEAAGVASGISTVVGTPENPWGVIGVHDSRERSYADHDVKFVQSVGRLLTSAIRRKERERQLEQYEAMLNAVGDGVYALDADSRFVAVNDAYVEMTGYAREELLGEHVSKVLREEQREGSRWIQDALEDGRDLVTMETTLPTADGDSIPIETRVASLQMGDVNGRVGVVRDVSDRKRREQKLTSLNEMLESLAEAESATDISDVGVNAAVETLGFPNAAVALYDDEANALVSTVRRWSDGEIDDALLGNHAADVAWQTFVESESRVYEDLRAGLDAEVKMGSAIAVPLGKYGVLLAASSEVDAFDQTDQSLADVLCSNVRSALDRAEREGTLRSQRNELQEKNRELERANRLNKVIREITKALTRASSQEDVTQAVCDRLTETGPYRFAWFGDYDRATGRIHPRASAGVEEGYLEEISVTADEEDDRGQGPAGRAVRTKEIQTQNDLLGDPPFEPWREKALKRGYRSGASVPVIYGDTLRGVFNLYAAESGVFNETETEVLAELGEFIGYALNALEQKQALVSEQSVELDFRIRGTGSPVLSFVAETGAEFEFENVVQRADGQLHAFFSVRGASPDTVVGHAEQVSWIESIRLVTERDDESLYECSVGDRSFLRSLVDRGAMPQTLTAADGEGRFVVRVPQSANVRRFVNLFEDYYGQVELVARREVDEPVMTRQEFEAELLERLTERQEEVLQTAYFGGFFEWPRESTAEEIADSLGVSQPTVSRHVRSAERSLFGLLFEDRGDEDSGG